MVEFGNEDQSDMRKKVPEDQGSSRGRFRRGTGALFGTRRSTPKVL